MDRIFLSPPHQTGTEAAWMERVLESNYLAPVGPMLEELEAEMSQLTGQPHCLAVNTGTAALHLALRHLMDQMECSDQRPPVVIAASLSFIASVAPAIQLGCEVWLCDCEEDSWTIDPTLVEEALSSAKSEGRDVLCVLPTDLYGQACDLEALRKLCDPDGIPILCDSAEALGVKRKGPNPDTQIFSFNGNKIITSSGGGILASTDAELIAHARKLASQARESTVHYEHLEVGYNYRMSNLLAAVALSQLEILDDRVRKRREIFEGYQKRLQDMDGISFMPEADWNTATRWLSVIRIDPSQANTNRENIRLALEAKNIESRPVWKPLHLQPALKNLRTFGGELAEKVFEEGLCLPSGHALTDTDQDRISDVVRHSVS